jgi:sortase A
MDKRLIYFLLALLLLVVGALAVSFGWASRGQLAPATPEATPVVQSTLTPLGRGSTQTFTLQPEVTPTEVVTTMAINQPTASVPPATPLPTIAPQAAATALGLYQPQLAAQGGDPTFRIAIPDIDVDAGIATLGWHTEDQNGGLVAVWDDPQYAVGYVVSSAIPGANGNTVMIGHNNIFGAVFRKLSELKRGATIDILFQGEHHAFMVTEVKILKETGATPEQQAATLRYFDPTPDTRLTLLSCWPETSNTHRVVVIAKPVN